MKLLDKIGREFSACHAFESGKRLLEKRSVKVDDRTLELRDVVEGLKENHVVVSDQDRLRPAPFVRLRMAKSAPPEKPR